MIDKSVEAYVLALETINRLSVQYRLEVFCFLICNAWELLLKAKIVHDAGSINAIYFARERGKPRRSIPLRDSLKRVFPNEHDPERINLECIADLRDEAVHLIISQIPREIMCVFQSGVINYHRRLNEWFGMSLSDRIPVGMMSIVYDLGPERCDMDNKRLRRELGRDAFLFLSSYCDQLKQEYDRLGRPAQFSIGIEYRLALTSNTSDADILLTGGPTGTTAAQIIAVPKDPGKSHPWRQKDVLEKLKVALPDAQINQHDIQCIKKVYDITKRPEYFYKCSVKNSQAQYSDAFVKFIEGKYSHDLQFFTKTRAKAKQMRN